MILDIAELPSGRILHTDLCIVGAGPAGLAVALALAGSGLDRVVLEGGGRRAEPATQALYRGHRANPDHPEPHRFRERRLGGTSTIWGGRCAPLDPQDFEARPWMPGSGWPIDAAVLRPHWAEAARLLELGGADFEAATAIAGGMRPTLPGFDDRGDVTTARIERFSRPTDLGRAHAETLRRDPGLRLILHANATRLRLDPDSGRVTEVLARSLRGHVLHVRPRAVVLAAGGLETARLMLAHGLGGDMAGRHLMAHLACTAGRFRPAPGRPAPFHGYERDAAGVYCRRRFSVSAALQERLAIGNAIARFHHPELADPAHRTGPLSALWLGRGLLRFEYGTRLTGTAARGATPAHALNLLRDAPATARFVAAVLPGRVLPGRRLPSLAVAPRAGAWTLDLHAEQAPSPASRVRLAADRDPLGLPRLIVDWRASAIDGRTARLTLRAIGAALRTGGHGTLELDEAALEASLAEAGAYGGHHLGTARMAASPAQGVTDADGRVHDHPNLFVAGGAVFATSGQANPTFTIVTLALRLAAHLARELGPARLRCRRDDGGHVQHLSDDVSATEVEFPMKEPPRVGPWHHRAAGVGSDMPGTELKSATTGE